MRLLELRIERYGHFSSMRLPLDGEGCLLHVILGPNEAGKSTLLDAISDLLFGFPARSPYGFRFENNLLRVGAAMERSDGERLEVVRRKGMRNTLTAPDQKPVDEAVLARMLGGATRTVFEDLFALNEERLREGGRNFVAGKGNVGEALFSASGLVADVRKVLDALDAEARSLWVPTARQAEVPIALRRIGELAKEKAKAQLSVATWQKDSREATTAAAESGRAEEKLRERRRELGRLQRIRRCIDTVTDLRVCEQTLAELEAVPLLQEIQRDRRVQTEDRLRRALDSLDKVRAESRDTEGKLAGLPGRAPILDHSVAIELLRESRSVTRKGVLDLPKRREEAAACEHMIESLATKAGLPNLRPDGAGLPAAAVVESLRRLAAQHSGVESTWKACEATLRREKSDFEEKREAAGRPLPPDPAPLESILESTARSADLSTQVEKAKGEARDTRDEAEVRFLRLNPRPATLDALRTVAVPLDDSLARHERAITDCEQDVRAAKVRLDEARDDLAARHRELSEAEAGTLATTEEELREARARRADAWARLRRDVVDREAGPPAREIGGPLADAFEIHVGEADSIADARYRNATAIARIESHRKEIAKSEKAVGDASENVRQEETRHAAAMAAWAEAWHGTGIMPLPPAEMRRWNDERKEILRLLDGASRSEKIAESLERQEATAADEIRREMVALGLEPPAGSPGLAALRIRARTSVDRLKEERQAHATAAQTLEAAKITLRTAERAHEEAVRARDEWQRAWDAAIAPLGRDTAIDPTDAESVLGPIESIRTEVAKRVTLVQRIDAIGRDLDAFGSTARDLARAVGLAAPASEPSELADAILSELSTATEVERDRVNLGEVLEKSRKAERETEAGIERDRAELAGLAKLLATDDLSNLAAAEKNAADKRDASNRRKELIDRLRAEGDPDEIRREVENADLDSLDADVEGLGTEIAALEADHKALAEKTGAARLQLESHERSKGSADLAQDEENEVGRLRSAVERWVRLRVASAVLGRALESYREKNQDPLVSIASERFAALTAGAFERLATDLGDHGPELRAVRAREPGDAGEPERLLSTGLSLGTADQLFLALRLAAVERYCAASEPLPFVADDLLPSFDDDRTRAAIASLAKLGETTQVLLFTHHAAVADLARESLGPAVRIHRLADLQRQDPAATKGA